VATTVLAGGTAHLHVATQREVPWAYMEWPEKNLIECALLTHARTHVSTTLGDSALHERVSRATVAVRGQRAPSIHQCTLTRLCSAGVDAGSGQQDAYMH
jgi:hypothetical protein